MSEQWKSEWQPVFAWLPVTVDAYDTSEIRNGHMSYTVWLRWVERRLHTFSDDAGSEVARWRYRLAK